MSTCYEDIREALDHIPCINAHIHQGSHEAEEQPAQGDGVGFVTRGLFDCSARDYAPQWEKLSGRDAWDFFVGIWPRIRCTGYGRMAAAKLRTLGVSDELTPETYDEINDRFRRHSPDDARRAYERAGIRGSLSDVIGHPNFGGLNCAADFLEGRHQPGDGFFPLLHVTGMHGVTSPEELSAVERLTGTEFGSIDDIAEDLCKIAARAAGLGVVALKDTSAYTRGFAFGAPDRSAAEASFRRLRSGQKLEDGDGALSDFLFDALVRCAGDLRLPVALHTGFIFRVHPKTHVRHLAGMLERHPNVRFDLFHLNYPWLDDLVVLLHEFPNTTANCVWAQLLDPAATEEFLLRTVGSLPAHRVIGFGSDAHGLGCVLASLSVTKDIMAAALARLVQSRQISRQAALDVARIWLYEAPCDAYGLDRP